MKNKSKVQYFYFIYLFIFTDHSKFYLSYCSGDRQAHFNMLSSWAASASSVSMSLCSSGFFFFSAANTLLFCLGFQVTVALGSVGHARRETHCRAMAELDNPRGTRTGRAILSVTFAPEAQPGPRKMLQGSRKMYGQECSIRTSGTSWCREP